MVFASLLLRKRAEGPWPTSSHIEKEGGHDLCPSTPEKVRIAIISFTLPFLEGTKQGRREWFLPLSPLEERRIGVMVILIPH